MKKVNRILCVIASILFLVNNIAFGDMKFASMNLAAESRLAPMNTPEFLDIAKITARILLLPDFHSYVFTDGRNLVETLTSARDGITNRTGMPDVERNGNRLAFYFRDREILDDQKTVLIPCSIQDDGFNNDENTPRWYIACIRSLDGNKIDCNCIKPRDCGMESFDQKSIGTILENPPARALLAKKEMSPEEKESVARFVEQENKTDKIIADAIWRKKETRIDAESTCILTIENFLKHLGNGKLREEFMNLAKNRQIMEIPDLEKPHAGGVGIYLADESVFNMSHREQIVHELFAKCGLLHEENDLMVKVFNEWFLEASVLENRAWEYMVHSLNEDFISKRLVEWGDEKFFEKAKNASFENRLKDPYKIDYYGDNQKKLSIKERAEEYLRKKTEPGKVSMIFLSEWQKETESFDLKESLDLLYSLCTGFNSEYRMEFFCGKDHLFFSSLPHFVIYRYDAKELVDVKEKKEIIQRFLREEFKRDILAGEESILLQLMDFDPTDGLSKHLTKKDIADLLPEVCFAAGSEFVLEDIFKNSATVRINNYAKRVNKQKNLSMSEKVGMKAKWRISLREALGVAVSERMRTESLSENPIERRDKTKEKILLYEGLDNTTIIDTASREIKALLSLTDESPVFFMPQELTNTERCQALTEEYVGAKFVPFNQYDSQDLDNQLKKYPARRKVVVTIDADYNKIKHVYESHKNLMPLNFSRGNIEETLNKNARDESRKNLEKTVISIALLTGALPAEDYTSVCSFYILSSLLKLVIPERDIVETYIESLVNFAAGDSEKLSFLVGTQLRPIEPYDVQELSFIVKTLISA